MIFYTYIPSPLGIITAACENNQIIGLWLPGQQGIIPTDADRRDNEPVLADARNWLNRYFAGEALSCTLPVRPRGTVFQQRVWDILREIPYGQTTTYGEIAARFGDRMSAQAVGQAVGRNPVSILIPCHRVLGAGRKLTGYAGGLDKKIYLLEIEKISYKI